MASTVFRGKSPATLDFAKKSKLGMKFRRNFSFLKVSSDYGIEPESFQFLRVLWRARHEPGACGNAQGLKGR